MTTISDNTISTPLASDLIRLAEIAGKSNKNEKNLKEINEVAATVLKEIDSSIISLNISSQLYLNNIKEIIEGGLTKPDNWNALPGVSSIRVDINELRAIADVIDENMNTIAIDILSLMAEILKMQRASIDKIADQRMISKKNKIQLNADEIQEKTNAAKLTFTSEMVTSVISGLTAGIQIGMSVKSMKKAKSNVESSINAEKLNEELKSTNLDFNIKKVEIDEQETMLKKLEIQSMNMPNNDAKKLKINNNSNEIKDKIKTYKKEAVDFEQKATSLELQIGTINSKVSAESQKIASKTAHYNVIGTAIKAVGDIPASGLRLGSRTQDIAAERDSKNSGLMSDSEQTYTESLRKITDLVRELVQSLHSMLQALDTPGTRITA